MTTTIEIEVECEGRYLKGSRDSFNNAHGNWLPGDPEEIEDFRVYLTRYVPHLQPAVSESERWVKNDITEFLSEDQYNELYEDFLNSCREEE